MNKGRTTRARGTTGNGIPALRDNKTCASNRRVEIMRCTHCGTETSPENADEPVGGAALGPDDEEVRCPECVTGAHRQATGGGFAPAQPGQWMDDKVREIRLRRGATTRGLPVMSSR